MKPEEAAFPIEDFDLTHAEGLSKREWFAGLAVQGILASGRLDNKADAATCAVSVADALLAELSK